MTKTALLEPQKNAQIPKVKLPSNSAIYINHSYLFSAAVDASLENQFINTFSILH